MNLYFTIWVTTACNLRCSYCYEGLKKEPIFLTKMQSERIVLYIKQKIERKESELNCGVSKLFIELHGGEPLVNFQGLKDFIETANKILAKHDISYQVTTNGTLLNDDKLVFLQRNVQSLTLSLDGDRCTNDLYRKDQAGNGTYAIVVKNGLKLLEKFSERLRIRMTFNAKTVECLADNILHLLNLRFKTIVALPDIFDRNWDESSLSVAEQQVERISEFRLDSSVYVNLHDSLILQNKGVCTGGCDGENIFPNGDIYPCTMAAGLSEYLIGNISEGIINQKVETIREYSSRRIDACDGCAYYIYCDSVRCKIINKMANGDYYQPIAVQCAFNRALLKYNGFRHVL